jgi:hypothetical protein
MSTKENKMEILSQIRQKPKSSSRASDTFIGHTSQELEDVAIGM